MGQRSDKRAFYNKGVWKRRNARYYDTQKDGFTVNNRALKSLKKRGYKRVNMPGVPKVPDELYAQYMAVRDHYELHYSPGLKHSQIPGYKQPNSPNT